MQKHGRWYSSYQIELQVNLINYKTTVFRDVECKKSLTRQIKTMAECGTQDHFTSSIIYMLNNTAQFN
jgi:hypothetical protein